MGYFGKPKENENRGSMLVKCPYCDTYFYRNDESTLREHILAWHTVYGRYYGLKKPSRYL